MKIENLIRFVKTVKLLKVILPIILAVLGIASRIAIAKLGDPGGDPIDDDPIPF